MHPTFSNFAQIGYSAARNLSLRDLARAGYSAAIDSSLGLSAARNGIILGAAIGVGLALVAATTEKTATMMDKKRYQATVRSIGTTSIQAIQYTAKVANYFTSHFSTVATISGVAVLFAHQHLQDLRAKHSEVAVFTQFATEPFIMAAKNIACFITSALLAESIVRKAKILEAMNNGKDTGALKVGRAALQAVGKSAVTSIVLTGLKAAGAGILVEAFKTATCCYFTAIPPQASLKQ
jgi:hypothetical protein